MPKGVEKIGLVDQYDSNVTNNSSKKKYKAIYVLKADSKVDFEAKYHKDSSGIAKWVVKHNEKFPITTQDKTIHTGDVIGITIPAKYCGPGYYQMMEAFVNTPENKIPTCVNIRGFAPEKIISTVWSEKKGGGECRFSPIKYGDDLWLNIQTEGLNGIKLDIEVYNLIGLKRTDPLIHKYTSVKCSKGEINLNIKNTYNWLAKVGGFYVGGIEKFYIKVRKTYRSEVCYVDDVKKDYITDVKKTINHATFLRIENKISKKEVQKSTSSLPLKLGNPEVIVERYDPCKLDEITITEKDKPITIFDNGTKTTSKSGDSNKIERIVYFKFDTDTLTQDAKEFLLGIKDFLLNYEKYTIILEGYACVIGKENYNDELSQRRTDVIMRFFVESGLNASRIISNGKGELNIKDEDNIKNKDEKSYSESRKVDIRIYFTGNNANAIIYESIAGGKGHENEITIDVKEYNTDFCFKDEDKHNTDVRIISPVNNERTESGTKKFKYKVFSSLPADKDYFDLNSYAPFKYFRPSKCSTNNYFFYINSCRYFSSKNSPSVIVKVYPDIKWDFHVFFKLSKPLSIAWGGYNEDDSKELFKVAGHMGAEERWRYSNTAFGVVLKASWNKAGNSYSDEINFTKKYESRIKSMHNTISTFKKIAQGVTKGTKGIVKKKVKKYKIEVIPPNICLGAEWQLARGFKQGESTSNIGTEYKYYLKAEPFVGLELTIDLLALALDSASVGLTGNTAASTAVLAAREFVEKGAKTEYFEANMRIWFDLVLTGEINGGGHFKYNNASDVRSGGLEFEGVIKAKITAGIEMKAKAMIVLTEDTEAGLNLTGALSASGTASLKFGFAIEYETYDGCYLSPSLTLPPITASYSIVFEVGVYYRKNNFSYSPVNNSDTVKLWKEPIKILKNINGGKKPKLYFFRN